MKRPTQNPTSTLTNHLSNPHTSNSFKEETLKRRKKSKHIKYQHAIRVLFVPVLIVLAIWTTILVYFLSNTDEGSYVTRLAHGVQSIKNNKGNDPLEGEDDDKESRFQTRLRYARQQNIGNHNPNAIKHKSRSKVQLEDIGDKSKRYQDIRNNFDKRFPPETIESRASFVHKLRKRKYESMSTPETIGYDVFNCPDDPPENYPADFLTLDILSHWNPDDPEPRTQIYQGICVFQYSTEYDKAMRYREAEVPFVIRDDPKVLQTVERWSQPEYLQQVLGEDPHRAEFSENNHFMYWAVRKRKSGEVMKPEGWEKPTQIIRMTYKDWLSKANVTDDSLLGPDNPHWYFRLIGCGLMGENCDRGNSEWLYNDLSFFKPSYDETLYLTDPQQQKGIHCRFGMKGVIAENHFDGTRNMIALLGGERRYILSHPRECQNLCLYPKEHPSGRHSAVDWSNLDLDKYPQFANAKSNEIVLQAGDVLYLPTAWFHYIVSLEMNFQCNARSGISYEYRDDMVQCGFGLS